MIHASLILAVVLASAGMAISAYALWKAPNVIVRLRAFASLLIASAVAVSALMRLLAPENRLAAHGSTLYMIAATLAALYLLYWTRRQHDENPR